MSASLAFLLDPAVRHERVWSTVRRLWGTRERTSLGLCLGLHRLFRDQVHRGRGRARFADWAQQKFGIPAKLAGLFSWLGSKLEDLPVVLAAMDRGELTYTKFREFANLVTAETQEEWIEIALTRTNRELELYVSRKQRESGTETVTVVSKVTPEGRQAARAAREVLTKTTGRRIRPAELHEEMAKAIAAGRLFGAGGETGDAVPKPLKPSAYVSFQPCPVCLECFVPVPEGLLRVPAEKWMRALRDGADWFDQTRHFFCDCEGLKHRKDRCPNWTFERNPPPDNRHIPAAVLRQIEARDGLVCRTPDCGCEVPLEKSHLTRYCEGTPPQAEFLRLHCATCNDLIESGALRVVGMAPYERYYNADGDFLGFGYERKSSHVGVRPQARGEEGSGGPEPPEVGVDDAA